MEYQTTVAVHRGESRPHTLTDALNQIIDRIDWPTRRHVVVKPNLVMADRPAAVTHRDALAAVLAAIRQRYNGLLTIAEGCAVHSTAEAFLLHDYPSLAAHFNAELVDLNSDGTVTTRVYSRRWQPLDLRIARTIVESDCRISLSVPKTHDTVLATLSIKNMIMGALVNRRLSDCQEHSYVRDRLGQILHGHGNGWGSDKVAMHQSYPAINLNLGVLAPQVWPHLSILDGTVAMEGAGPVDGDPVAWGIVLTGTDPLAVDATAARLMGFQTDEIGYLTYCAQLGLGTIDAEQIEIVGNVPPDEAKRSFRRHPTHAAQAQWFVPNATTLLQQLVPRLHLAKEPLSAASL